MFNAKFSSADEVYESIYKQVKSSIYVVDNYIGLRTLVHLKNSPTGVNITLFSDNVGNNKLHNIEFTDFCKEYPSVKISMKKTGGIFHDRFIVLDYGTADERVFLCGASSKDAGARITSIVEDYGISKIEHENIRVQTIKRGKYGGTFAHKDIAFEFASAISPVFKLYLIKEFQRLKEAVLLYIREY